MIECTNNYVVDTEVVSIFLPIWIPLRYFKGYSTAWVAKFTMRWMLETLTIHNWTCLQMSAETGGAGLSKAVSSCQHLMETRGWPKWQWHSSPVDARAGGDKASSPTTTRKNRETCMTGSFFPVRPRRLFPLHITVTKFTRNTSSTACWHAGDEVTRATCTVYV